MEQINEIEIVMCKLNRPHFWLKRTVISGVWGVGVEIVIEMARDIEDH